MVTMPAAVMVHHGRCGSTVLGDMLNQHSKVHWDGEIYYQPGWMDALAPMERIHFERDGIEHMRSSVRGSNKAIYGFEFQPHNLIPMSVGLGEYFDLCEEAGVSHFIHLRRKNMLRKMTSSLVALARDKFHYRTDETPEMIRIKIDVDNLFIKNEGLTLLGQLDKMCRNEEVIAKSFERRKAIFLSYEDDVESDPQVGYEKLCSFLDVNPEVNKIAYVKSTAMFKMSEIMENWSDVVRVISGTRYEWMLTE